MWGLILILLVLFLVAYAQPWSATVARTDVAYNVHGRAKKVPPMTFDGSPVVLKQSVLNAMADLLQTFDEAATAAGIEYWVTGDTLLGAARHAGFVPWRTGIEIGVREGTRLAGLKGLTYKDGKLSGSGWLPTIRVTTATPETLGKDVYPLQRVPFEDFYVWAPYSIPKAVEDQFGSHALGTADDTWWWPR